MVEVHHRLRPCSDQHCEEQGEYDRKDLPHGNDQHRGSGEQHQQTPDHPSGAAKSLGNQIGVAHEPSREVPGSSGHALVDSNQAVRGGKCHGNHTWFLGVHPMHGDVVQGMVGWLAEVLTDAVGITADLDAGDAH